MEDYQILRLNITNWKSGRFGIKVRGQIYWCEGNGLFQVVADKECKIEEIQLISDSSYVADAVFG